jgi:hypothetical protein
LLYLSSSKNKKKKEQHKETRNIKHKTQDEDKKNKEWTTQRQRQYWAQDTGRRQIKQRMDNPEIQEILSTRHRTKTSKKKNGQHRDTGNIRHKTQDEDK